MINGVSYEWHVVLPGQPAFDGGASAEPSGRDETVGRQLTTGRIGAAILRRIAGATILHQYTPCGGTMVACGTPAPLTSTVMSYVAKLPSQSASPIACTFTVLPSE